jgi:hypothetical protein
LLRASLILRPWRWRWFCFSATSVDFDRTTRRHILEDRALQDTHTSLELMQHRPALYLIIVDTVTYRYLLEGK